MLVLAKIVSIIVVGVLALAGGFVALTADIGNDQDGEGDRDQDNGGGHDGGGDGDGGTSDGNGSGGHDHDGDGDHDGDPPVIESGDLTIHFLELGNKFTGDCVYINYGEIDILIDAGSHTSSSATITNYINQHIQDNKIEYVIATHAHMDHIGGFYSTKTTTGIFDSFEIGTIIEYSKANTTSDTRKYYEAARDQAVERGAEHYTALQCYNNEDGAQRVYELGPGVTMEILYHKYYVDKFSSNENNYSVCIMITQDGNQYLFTGDLEKGGEDSLVAYYDANHGGLGHCVLYKGGHHGSKTSSNVSLLKAITPDYIIICTCAGSTEYNATKLNRFPTQDFINRVAIYTDKIYVTTLMIDYNANVYESFNGDVIFSIKDGEVVIICSADDRILKDTEWFRDNRETPDAWKPPEPEPGT